MASNIERLEKDLDSLISNGQILFHSMQHESYGEKFDKVIREQLGDEEGNELLKELPSFKSTYDSWYSESLALIKQLLPDRVTNFISFYEKPKGRKVASYGDYYIQDYLQNLRVSSGLGVQVDSTAAIPQFQQQLAILQAVKRRFRSSLFEMKQLVQADLFDSEIDAARELLKSKFYRAAGAVAEVVLEKHLQQVCDDHNIMVKKNPGISVLNEALKSNSIIDVPQWRHISMLGDIRNQPM